MPRPTRPLIGREAERDHLVDALGLGDPSAAGHAVLLGGDAGIGKTRLVDELSALASTQGWRVLTGHCLDVGEDEVAYLPFTEALGRLASDEPDRVAALVGAHPAARRLLPGRRDGTDAVPVERGELLESVVGLLADLAAEGPVLLVVEDAHWADQSTRDALSLLLARPSTNPLRLLVSYRTDDLHRRHPLRPALAQWGRLGGVDRVQLTPLSDADVRTLARGLGPVPLADVQLSAVVDRADGNAFFVEELVGALDAGGHDLPLDLADLLLLRLESLDDGARAVVRTAAVAGRRVDVDLLAAVVDLDDVALDAALRVAVERHVLVADSSGEFSFRHALLAEAVYDDLMPGERTRLHGRYARLLGDGAARGAAAELARHARLSGRHDVALRASIAAGDEAMLVGGPGEAARHYERALEMLGDDGGTDGLAGVDAVDLTVRACRALIEGGLADRAAGLAADALEHLPGDAGAADRVRLLTALTEAAMVGDVGEDAEVVAARAFELADQVDDALRARLLGLYARAARFDRADEALAAANEAVQLAERTGQPRLAVDARVTIARIEETLGDPDANRRVLADVVRQARSGGDLVAELRGGYHLATLRLEDGDPVGATDAFAAVARRAREVRRPWAPFGIDAWTLSVVSAYMAGDWDAALEAADLTGWSPPPVPAALVGGAALLVRAGRGEADRRGELVRMQAVWDSDVFVAMLAGGAGIDLEGDAGDAPAAIDLHDRAVEQVARGWGPDFGARVRFGGLLLGQLAGRAGTADAAQRAAWLVRADAAVETARRIGGLEGGRRRGVEARAWELRTEAERSRLRWECGEPTDAEAFVELWARTVQAFTETGHVFETARSRARHSAALRAVGRREEATRAAADARAVATRLGARPLLRELAAGRLAPARDDGRPDALTPREHEILQLVARGRTNGEIGTQLFISTKTASVHVSRILAKLGASGRTEAAAIGRRRGLVEDP